MLTLGCGGTGEGEVAAGEACTSSCLHDTFIKTHFETVPAKW